MGACSKTSKFFLLLLNLIIWAAAAALLYVGIDLINNFSHYDDITSAVYAIVPSVIVIGTAVLLFIVGLIGCIGTCKEHKCLLGTFFVLLLIIFVAEISAGATGYLYRHDVENIVETGIQKGLDNYDNSSLKSLSDEINYMQKKLVCCGVHNYTDWFETPWYKKNHTMELPGSCCGDGRSATCHLVHNGTQLLPPTNVHTKGCFPALTGLFMDNLVTIAAVSITFAVIQIIGMVSACVLMHRSREVPYLTLTSSGGYRA